MRTAKEALSHNIEEFMEKGPGLRSTTLTAVVARAPGKSLVTGLGGMGVGTMWFGDESYKDQAGYEDIPFYENGETDVWFNGFTGELVNYTTEDKERMAKAPKGWVE